MSQSNLFADPTYRVSQLAEEVKLFLSEAFPSVWVVGEVQRLRSSQRGHVYFELVEKGTGDQILGKLDAVLWRTAAQRVRRELATSGQELVEGIQIRCQGRLDFYPPAGRLQFSVDAVDPVFSLGELERRRRETLLALAAAGLMERNGLRSLTELPLRVGLVTSEGSAAYHDFLTTLKSSPYRFEVLMVHASVQGPSAEREVAAGLTALAGLAGRSRLDATVLIRGGGSRSDLAAFDSRRIAESVASHPVPVITGLGHEIDRSVADQVAHTAIKTPTGVAEFLVRRVERAEAAIQGLGEDLAVQSRNRVLEAARSLELAQRQLAAVVHLTRREARRLSEVTNLLDRVARQRVTTELRRLEVFRDRLLREAPRRPRVLRDSSDGLIRKVVTATEWRLAQASRDCQSRARLARSFGPQRILARGFSVTRTEVGTVVRNARDIESGEVVRTELHSGSLVSRVESLAPKADNDG